MQFHLSSGLPVATWLFEAVFLLLKPHFFAHSFNVHSPRLGLCSVSVTKWCFVSSLFFLFFPLLSFTTLFPLLSQTTGSFCQAAGQHLPKMPSLQFLLFVTLLAAVVLAAPAPSSKRGLEKRSFQVPRQLNTAHPGPNGPAALRKVFRKYNFKPREEFMVKDGFISFSKQAEDKAKTNASAAPAGSKGSNKTGTVAANPGENAALFLSPVTIGGQTLNLDFDSGSSDL